MGSEEKANGAGAPLDLQDYVIVGDGKEYFLGRFVSWVDGHHNWMALDPAYAYPCGWPMNMQTGGIDRLRAVCPLETMVSPTKIEVRPTSVFRLSQLDEVDADFFRKQIAQVDTIRKNTRAARSNLTLATAMPTKPAPGPRH